jgi:TonB family protein
MTGPAGRVSAAIAVSVALHTAVLAAVPGLFSPGSPGGEARSAPFEVRIAGGPAAPPAIPKPRLAAGPKAQAVQGPYYFRGSELDAKPAPLTPIEPAATARTAGRVIARVLINESGRVDAVHIVASEPMKAFDEAVKTAFGSARYRPGMKAGRSVKSQMLVEVTFHGGASAGPVSARPN